MALDTANLLERLSADVPGVRTLRDADPELWSEQPPNNYAVFGCSLLPHLLHLLELPRNHEEELYRLFLFFEEMVFSDSAALSDLLLVQIIEPLRGNRTAWDSALRHAGEGFKKLAAVGSKKNLQARLVSLLSGRLAR
jgi:hypothetical protein